ncbi:MAG: FAD-dependent monooxygenase, partial [Ignavibacteriales bacterium]|nr:FAD-dependent monooxygenase [Ignavibacteriales bacterium]
LARAGVKVLVCDKAKFPREKICGDCINPKCWQMFEILGITEELHSKPLSIIENIKITNSKGQTIESRFSTRLNAPFFAIKRGELDMLLLRNAKNAGALIYEETRVTNIRWTNRWEVLVNQNGRDTIVNCDVLIGADGRNSIVAQKLSSLSGNKSSATKISNTERVGIQWHTHYQPSIGSSVEMFFFESGYGGLVNVSSEHANVALVTHPEIAQRARQDFPEFLRQTMLGNPRALKIFSSLDPVSEMYTAYPINPESHLAHHPSAFLIGDARQTVEPFTGEGIYFALQDGIGTAGKILQLLKKKESSSAIKSHSRFWVNTVFSPLFQRHSVVEPLIAAGSHMPRLVSFLFRTVFS